MKPFAFVFLEGVQFLFERFDSLVSMADLTVLFIQCRLVTFMNLRFLIFQTMNRLLIAIMQMLGFRFQGDDLIVVSSLNLCLFILYTRQFPLKVFKVLPFPFFQFIFETIVLPW